MAKLIIFSIVLMSFVLPIWSSSTSAPRRDLRRMQRFMVLFILVWSFLCLHWYPQLVSIE